MNQYLSYVGVVVGIIGFIYAVFENRKRIKLNEFIRSNNWFNYQRVNNSTGEVQLTLKLYREKHKTQIDPDVLQELAKADAFGQEVLKEIIRQIHLSEPSFTAKDFERWKKEGKLTEENVVLFKKFATDTKSE
jgi:hypothetical protein